MTIPADKERPTDEELERYRRNNTTANTLRWPDGVGPQARFLDISMQRDDPPYGGRYLPSKEKG